MARIVIRGKSAKDMKNYDLDFITTARKALSEGDHIVYSCWW
jgi:hypothetical protein